MDVFFTKMFYLNNNFCFLYDILFKNNYLKFLKERIKT